jgi:hypothetical protein
MHDIGKVSAKTQRIQHAHTCHPPLYVTRERKRMTEITKSKTTHIVYHVVFSMHGTWRAVMMVQTFRTGRDVLFGVVAVPVTLGPIMMSLCPSF